MALVPARLSWQLEKLVSKDRFSSPKSFFSGMRYWRLVTHTGVPGVAEGTVKETTGGKTAQSSVSTCVKTLVYLKQQCNECRERISMLLLLISVF